MAIFSKPISISPTCYELGHCWTPYCHKASTDIATKLFTESLKIYGTFYLVAGILRKRGLKYYIKKFVPETIRSSLFLTINGTLFISMFCIWRKMLGCLFFLTASFIPAYIAAFIAVLFERKSRRGPLAVYLTNLAIETGYRMLVERKIVAPIRNGEVYLFSAVSAVYLYLFRRKGGLSDATQSLFKFFVGSEECPPITTPALSSEEVAKEGSSNKQDNALDEHRSTSSRSKSRPEGYNHQHSGTSQLEDGRQSHSDSVIDTASLATTPSSQPKGSISSVSSSMQASVHKLLQKFPFAASLLQYLKGHLQSFEELPAHKCCLHGQSCVSYVLKGGAKMFSFGYLVQAVLSSLSVITRILRYPATLRNTCFSRLNLKLAAFLGGYCFVFRAVNCALRWLRGKDSELHGCVAGALAGLTLRFYRSTTIALYTATKLMEIVYFKGIQSYGLPYFKSADIFIYAFSAAFILHAAVVEPHTLRPGYWQFLLRITDNRFAFMNRKLLDVFGVNSSKIQPDYWPDYEPNFTTLARHKS